MPRIVPSPEWSFGGSFPAQAHRISEFQSPHRSLAEGQNLSGPRPDRDLDATRKAKSRPNLVRTAKSGAKFCLGPKQHAREVYDLDLDLDLDLDEDEDARVGFWARLFFHALCDGTGAVGCGHLPACLGIAGGGTFRGVGSGRSGGVGVVSRVFVFAGSVPWARTGNTAFIWWKIQIKWRRPLSKCKEIVRKGDFMSAGKKGPF